MFKQDGWRGFPSGREKIAMELKLCRADIERRYGLEFISGSDSLGSLSSTYFIDDVLGTVSILIYDSMSKTAGVYVDSKVSTRFAVARLVNVFGLDEEFLNLPVENHRD
jgi:hypothetical protein